MSPTRKKLYSTTEIDKIVPYFKELGEKIQRLPAVPTFDVNNLDLVLRTYRSLTVRLVLGIVFVPMLALFFFGYSFVASIAVGCVPILVLSAHLGLLQKMVIEKTLFGSRHYQDREQVTHLLRDFALKLPENYFNSPDKAKIFWGTWQKNPDLLSRAVQYGDLVALKVFADFSDLFRSGQNGVAAADILLASKNEKRICAILLLQSNSRQKMSISEVSRLGWVGAAYVKWLRIPPWPKDEILLALEAAHSEERSFEGKARELAEKLSSAEAGVKAAQIMIGATNGTGFTEDLPRAKTELATAQAELAEHQRTAEAVSQRIKAQIRMLDYLRSCDSTLAA